MLPPGKTTALAELADTLPEHGVTVMRCPELSTLFFEAGAGFPPLGSRAQQVGWDYEKLKAQLALEDALKSIAAASAQPAVILADRGALDSKAFVAMGDEQGQREWEQLLARGGWDELTLRSRYDAVVVATGATVPRDLPIPGRDALGVHHARIGGCRRQVVQIDRCLYGHRCIHDLFVSLVIN